MANQEHLDILMQGVEVWNSWREEHADTQPDLSRSNLRDVDLRDVDLRDANLTGANLSGARLGGASLGGADLTGTNLSRARLSHAFLGGVSLINANLSGANLSNANLSGTFLISANISEANLISADLSNADLSNADLSRADLISANLSESNLYNTDFDGATIWQTVFGNVDLRTVKGLETMKHFGPSTIGIDTIIASQGHIPDIFLWKAGIPDSIIEAIPSLIGSLKPIDYYSCFISYSSKDQDFTERLYNDLQGKGVRCWFAPHDMRIGDKIRPRIDEAIHLHEKLLLVLSASSTASQWVEQEVATALAKERKQQRTILFPIRLDNAIMEIESDWPFLIRNTRNIGDFTHWENHKDYQKAFNRLLRDLKAEARKIGSLDANKNGR